MMLQRLVLGPDSSDFLRSFQEKIVYSRYTASVILGLNEHAGNY